MRGVRTRHVGCVGLRRRHPSRHLPGHLADRLVDLRRWSESLSLPLCREGERLVARRRPRLTSAWRQALRGLSLGELLLPGLVSRIRSYWWLFSKDVCLRSRLGRRRLCNAISRRARPATLHSVPPFQVPHVNAPITLTHMTQVRRTWLRTPSATRYPACILRAKYRFNDVHIFIVLLEIWWLSHSRGLLEEVWIE